MEFKVRYDHQGRLHLAPLVTALLVAGLGYPNLASGEVHSYQDVLSQQRDYCEQNEGVFESGTCTYRIAPAFNINRLDETQLDGLPQEALLSIWAGKTIGSLFVRLQGLLD